MLRNMTRTPKKNTFLTYDCPQALPPRLRWGMDFFSKPQVQEASASISGVPPALRSQPRSLERVKAQYVRCAAADLSFSQEVRWQRGLPSMPFTQYSFDHLYQADGLVAPPPRVGKAPAQKPGRPKLPPAAEPASPGADARPRKPRPRREQRKPVLARVQRPCRGLDVLDVPSPDESLEEREAWLPPAEKEARAWEAIVLAKLDRRTARWIESKRPARQSASPSKWQSFLRQQYDWSHIRDELTSASDLELLKQLEAEEMAELEDPKVSLPSEEIRKPELLLPVYYRQREIKRREIQRMDTPGPPTAADKLQMRDMPLCVPGFIWVLKSRT